MFLLVFPKVQELRLSTAMTFNDPPIYTAKFVERRITFLKNEIDLIGTVCSCANAVQMYKLISCSECDSDTRDLISWNRIFCMFCIGKSNGMGWLLFFSHDY